MWPASFPRDLVNSYKFQLQIEIEIYNGRELQEERRELTQCPFSVPQLGLPASIPLAGAASLQEAVRARASELPLVHDPVTLREHCLCNTRQRQ
jgi:hypothetical protein